MFSILLFLYASDFLYKANYVTILLVILCLWKSYPKIKISKLRGSLLLILASVSYFAIFVSNYGMPGISDLMLRFIAPFCLFYVGSCRGEMGEKIIIKDLYIVGFATFVHGFLNVLANRSLDILSIAGRQYKDIFGGQISGTLQNLLFIVPSSLLFYYAIYENKYWKKILGICMVLGGIYGTVSNASRTLLYVTLVAFVSSALAYSILNRKNIKAFRMWFLTGTLILLALITFSLNLFSVQDWFNNMPLGIRINDMGPNGSIMGNARLVYTLDILRLLPTHLMGNIPSISYAHNLWVDIARETGIVPFILYIAFTISTILSVFSILKRKNVSDGFKILIISVVVALISTFFTEPIMQGYPLIFGIFSFVSGAMSGFKKYSSNNDAMKIVR